MSLRLPESTSPPDTLPTVLANALPLHTLRAHERQLLLAAFHYQRLPAGTPLFAVGEISAGLIVVLDGLLVQETPEGQGAPARHLQAGDVLGEESLFLSHPHTTACVAATEATIAELRRATLEPLLHEQPGLALALGRLVSYRLQQMHHYTGGIVSDLQMVLLPRNGTLTIGSDPSNTVVLAPPVAAFHSRILAQGGLYHISALEHVSDLWVNGRQRHHAEVHDSDVVRVGAVRLVLREADLAAGPLPASVWLTAQHLSLETDAGLPLLSDVSVHIAPGSFVALMGISGSGKTTLLNALTGFTPAHQGSVRLNGVSLYDHLSVFRRAIGYVPQDSIVHGQLSAQSALTHAARLRLPDDTPAGAIATRVERTLRLLDLWTQRATPIALLSGGQRRRANIAVELLTDPGLLFLDEPTAGLDPAAALRLMTLLRQMSLHGQTVIVATHDASTITLCDQVLVLARGGRTLFTGTPHGAMQHFGVDDVSAIYTHIAQPADDLATTRTHTLPRPPDPAPPLPPRPGRSHHRSAARQTLTLLRRYLDVLRRDVGTLVVMAAQAPIMGLLLWLLFPAHIFSLNPTQSNPTEAMSIVFILCVTAIFFGATNASREIVKERSIFLRERFVGVGVWPYLLSKLLVLGAVGVVQVGLLLASVWMTGLLPITSASMAGMGVGILSLTVLAGTAMGLLLSALARSPSQASALVPLLLLPQIMFGGSLVPLDMMFGLGHALAQLTIARWAFSLLGAAVGMGPFLAGQDPATSLSLHSFLHAFAALWWPQVAVLLAMLALCLAASALALHRQPNRAATSNV